jgi:tetratricopeptide (TPR) repeat protein
MFERAVKSAQARFRDDKPYAEHVAARAKHLFERYKRGIKNGNYWFLGADEIPTEVWIPLLDGMRARRDHDVARCRAALKRLDRAVARALKQRGMREKLLKIGGDYAMLHGCCGNAAKVREILTKFRGKYDGPKPEQAFAALFDAGDKKAAAAVASRELKERLDEVTGKAGVMAAMNAHHSLFQLEDIFQAQLAAGDRDGVARGLDAVEKALGRKAGRNAEARAWALKTVADLEFRIGRPDRARAATEIAEKLATKARGAEIRSMSWRGVAEVYARLGEWDKAQAAIARIPSRHDKRGATLTMLIHRGDMDAVTREIAKMSGNEAKRDACELVAKVLEERSSSRQ